MDQDDNHLKLLSTFHYVVGGLTMLFSLFPLIHLVVGASLLSEANFLEIRSEQTPPNGGDLSPESTPSAPDSLSVRSDAPAIVAWFFVAFGATFFLMGEALGVCILLAGRFIQHRRRHLFVFVVACVQCVIFPFGTALGIFTIIVLSRPSVKARFFPPSPGAVSS